MNSIRDIIKEACARANVVPRKQAVPGDIQENAYRLLQGIVRQYNKDNLLAWTQNSIILKNSRLIHIYDETDAAKGKYNYYFDTVDELNDYPLTQEDVDNNAMAMVYDGYDKVAWSAGVIHHGDWDEYRWFGHRLTEPYSQRVQEMKRYMSMEHVQIRNVDKINSIFVVSNTNEPYKEYYELDFINHTDYDKFSQNSRSFTYVPKSQGEWIIDIKPQVALQNYRLKLNYNEGIEFDLDSELLIPDNYIELLIVSLTHKLAIMYPRIDEAQMNRLEKEVTTMINNVRTPNATDRNLQREDYFEGSGRLTQYDLLTGRYI